VSKTRQILESVHHSENFPLGEVRQHSGEPSNEVLALPWYRYVPKDHLAQLRWRRYVRVRGAEDKAFRHAILQACEEDILFFCNTLLWVYEPRRRRHKNIPLNTWIDQDDGLVWADECFGVRSCGVEKSRDLSWSWNCLIIFFKRWLFENGARMGVASLTEEKVDSPDDSDSMMWKLDFLFENLPEWARIDDVGNSVLVRTANDHRFYNRVKKSDIRGYASTMNLGRGGRKIAWLMDEFSEWPINAQQKALDATQFTTKCRYFPSTFSGDSDKFFSMMRRDQSTMLRIVADWKDNPEKKVGLYTSVGGHIKVLDKSYIFPDDYPFINDGKIRSPYYDMMCKEPGATPQSIARELDRDPQGATSKIFAASVLQKARESCKTPYFVGNLDFTPGEYRPIWVPDHSGRMFIWKDLDIDAKLPAGGTGKLGYGGPYAIAADIGAGSGSSVTSNSAIEVIDIPSGEQVLEYYSHTIRPVDFAQLFYVTCIWLCEGHDLSWAYANWESNGNPGEAFTTEMIRLGWANCYLTRKETVLYRERTERLGTFNADGGYTSLCELQRGIQQDEITIRSEKVVFECGQYELGKAGVRAGKCIHVGSQASGDASAQGKAHGDCAIAIALAWMAAKDRPVEGEKVVESDPESRYFEELEEKLFSTQRSHLLAAGASRMDSFSDLRHAI
jgi:hypothetical protein